MEKIEIFENGIHLQFAICEDESVQLVNFSCTKKEIPDDFSDDSCAYSPCEVHITGAEFYNSRHIKHRCPTIPKYHSHSDKKNESGRLFTLVLRTEKLEIKQFYQFYNGIKTISAWCEVENISNEDVGLEYVSSFCLMPGENFEPSNFEVFIPNNSWCEELNWQKFTLEKLGLGNKKLSGTHKKFSVSNTGNYSTKSHLPMGVLYNKNEDTSLLWQIESSCSWTWELSYVFKNLFLRVSGPSELENFWWKNLKPNQKFTSVKAAVSVTNGGFDEVIRSITEYRRRIVDNGRIDANLSVVFNDYMECLWANPTLENELPLIEKAAEAGAEVYCMDAGWYSTGDWLSRRSIIGEWQVCEEKFGGRFKEIFDKIKEKGMIPGIWIEPQIMGTKCPLVSEFEDCFFKRHGKAINTRGVYQLDFRCKKVTDHLTKAVVNLIEKYGIKFFKFDYNIDTTLGTESDADSFGDGLLEHSKAYLKWVDSLYELYPDLIIENCASGAMTMDYSTLQHFSIQSISDAAFYDEFAHMNAMAPTALIPEQTGIWVVTHPNRSVNQNAFAAVNGMLNRMYLSGRIDKVDDESFANLKEAVKCYKELRQDIHGSLPFFTDELSHYKDEWVSAMRLSGDKKTLYVTAGRLESETEEIKIDLSQVPKDKKNAEIIFPKNVGNISLCGDSLSVALPKHSAILIKIEMA
ncbi:MAG: alpha-galactosidase [Ruminococcaceae bacterium]|nr:alpha-galactosidase [Oscillospiraceae bacterium]